MGANDFLFAPSRKPATPKRPNPKAVAKTLKAIEPEYPADWHHKKKAAK